MRGQWTSRPSVQAVALIAKAEGRIDGVNARDFEEAMKAAISGDDAVVVIDLENLSYISSAGLRVILLIAKTLRKRNAELMLCSLSDPIREVFEISGFDKIIPVHASREQGGRRARLLARGHCRDTSPSRKQAGPPGFRGRTAAKSRGVRFRSAVSVNHVRRPSRNREGLVHPCLRADPSPHRALLRARPASHSSSFG